MQRALTTHALGLLFVSPLLQLYGQDLAPRAYLIAPVNSNAITLTWSGFNGGIDLNGAIPIESATATYQIPVLSYSHAFNFLGRSANFTGSLPYAVGNFKVETLETERQAYRSGLLGVTARLSVNLKGGPAMPLPEWAAWKQKGLLGASLKIVAPTGQYDPARVINWGVNRWAFKPEIGYSRRMGHWLLDGYAGVWLFTTNNAAYSVRLPVRLTQEPIGSIEGHLSRDFRQARAWLSLDGNFWFGGVTTRDNLRNPATGQTSSRLGGTASFPIGRSHSSVKVAYSIGTYVRYGGNYQQIAVAWQYSWIGKRF